MVTIMIFGHKNQPKTGLKVDLGDLQNEKENLTSFLQTHLKISITQVEDNLMVNSEKVPVQELQHALTKFVYHRNLNSTHWVSVEGTTVKINRFKGEKKKEKDKKEPPTKPPHKAGDFKFRFRFIMLFLGLSKQITLFRKTIKKR
jgi:hypothetical protein